MIVRVNGIYHYRKTVPPLLKEILRKGEVWQSLKTGDKHRASLLAGRLEYLIKTLEMDLSWGFVTLEEALQRLRAGRFRPKGTNKNSTGTRVLANLTVANEALQIQRPSAVAMQSPSHNELTHPDIRLEDWFERFSEERIAVGRWTKKTAIEYRTGFDLFTRYLRERGTSESEIDHQVLLDYKALLLKLPPNACKSPKYRKKSLLQLADSVHEKTLSNRQINKQLIIVNSFFGWLYQHEYILKNPAHHLLVQKDKKARDQDERSAYTPDEIKTILDKTKHLQGAKKYVPMIASYSGLRLNEACQLLVTDLITVDGIVCFDINDRAANSRLKTASSARIIPVHPRLIKNGLLKYLEAVKSSGSERLFPELSYHSTNGYGQSFTKWFSVFNRENITKDPLKTFHSLRHAVANELKQSGVTAELISELLGHRVESISMSRYGKKYRPEPLLDAIKKLPW